MKPTFRIGRLRLFTQSNWGNEEKLKIEFFLNRNRFVIQVYMLYHFEFEIDW